MNLITSLIWLGSGIVWTIMVVKDITNVWNWILAILSYAACVLYALKFDKELRK